MKRVLSTLTTIAVIASGAALLTAPSASAAAPAAKEKTQFALKGSGFGTRLRGGQVPAGSETTAYQVIGCTNVAGLKKTNHVAEATLPGLGTASEVTTDIWSTSKKGVVASHGRSSIERIVIGESNLGTLEINAVSTVTKAYHGKDGFKSEVRSRVGAIVFTDPTGTEQEFEAPTPGQPIEIPGLATITVGRHVQQANENGARAAGDALVVDVVATGTRLRVAKVASEINGDVKHGLFGGRSFSVQGDLLDGNLSIGRNPLSLMPCAGTQGEVVSKSLASLDLGTDARANGLRSRLQSDQTKKAATGWADGRVKAFSLGDDQVTAKAVVGRVSVTRTADGKLKRNANGTEVGTITVNGEEQEFPDTDVIEIPGLVKLERNIVKKVKDGIRVTALRITLLDGTGAVIDLGEAKLTVRDAGL
jgi:hypothetical protein